MEGGFLKGASRLLQSGKIPFVRAVVHYLNRRWCLLCDAAKDARVCAARLRLTPHISGLIPLLYHTAYLTLGCKFKWCMLLSKCLFSQNKHLHVLFLSPKCWLFCLCWPGALQSTKVISLASWGSYSSSLSSVSFCYLLSTLSEGHPEELLLVWLRVGHSSGLAEIPASW